MPKSEGKVSFSTNNSPALLRMRDSNCSSFSFMKIQMWWAYQGQISHPNEVFVLYLGSIFWCQKGIFSIQHWSTGSTASVRLFFPTCRCPSLRKHAIVHSLEDRTELQVWWKVVAWKKIPASSRKIGLEQLIRTHVFGHGWPQGHPSFCCCCPVKFHMIFPPFQDSSDHQDYYIF